MVNPVTSLLLEGTLERSLVDWYWSYEDPLSRCMYYICFMYFELCGLIFVDLSLIDSIYI